jgi:acyl carrier protein
MDTKDKIKAYIEETFLFGQGGLEEDTSLIEDHIIDSTGILEVIAFVERTFHVQVEDDEMIPENFNSVKSIASYIERKKGS